MSSSSFYRPSEGTSAITKFRIICRNWENSDPPTRYEFRYDNGAEEAVKMSSSATKELPLWYGGGAGSNELSVLPTGDPKNDFKIKFTIRIENAYGAYSTFNDLFVTVSAI